MSRLKVAALPPEQLPANEHTPARGVLTPGVLEGSERGVLTLLSCDSVTLGEASRREWEGRCGHTEVTRQWRQGVWFNSRGRAAEDPRKNGLSRVRERDVPNVRPGCFDLSGVRRALL